MIYSLVLDPLLCDTFKNIFRFARVFIISLIGIVCSTSTFAFTIPTSLVGTTLILTSSSPSTITEYYFSTSMYGTMTSNTIQSAIIYTYLPNYIDGPMISYSYGYGYQYDSKIFLTYLANNSGTYVRKDEAGEYGIITTSGTFVIDGIETSFNLSPFQPTGWSDKIVVSNTTGTSTDCSSLLPTETLYIDWAVINNGEADITTTFSTKLYINGVEKYTWTTSSLQANYYTFVEDYSIGNLPKGTYEIRIETDTTNVVSESDEQDNTYTKTIMVQGKKSISGILPAIYLLLDQ